jgi:hypothetical protein
MAAVAESCPLTVSWKQRAGFGVEGSLSAELFLAARGSPKRRDSLRATAPASAQTSVK